MTDLTQRGRRRPNTGRAALIAVAVTTLIAGAAALAYVVGWGIADDKQPAAVSASTDVAKQMQCTGIKREYDAWHKGAGLEEIDRLRTIHASYATKKAVDEGEALLKAVSGYKDAPSLELAVAVANYNFALGLVHLEATVSNNYGDKNYQEAMAARGDLNVKFNDFWAKTCS